MSQRNDTNIEEEYFKLQVKIILHEIILRLDWENSIYLTLSAWE